LLKVEHFNDSLSVVVFFNCVLFYSDISLYRISM